MYTTELLHQLKRISLYSSDLSLSLRRLYVHFCQHFNNLCSWYFKPQSFKLINTYHMGIQWRVRVTLQTAFSTSTSTLTRLDLNLQCTRTWKTRLTFMCCVHIMRDNAWKPKRWNTNSKSHHSLLTKLSCPCTTSKYPGSTMVRKISGLLPFASNTWWREENIRQCKVMVTN